MMRIASFAEIYGILVAPHNPYGPVALAAAAHAALKGITPLFESVGSRVPLLVSFRAKSDEGVVSFDFVLEILNDEFDHDSVIEIAEPRHAVGDQVIGVREVGESIQDALAVCTLEPPVLILEHRNQLTELRDSMLNVFGSVGPLDFFEQFFGFAENNRFVLGISTLADLLENLSEVAEIFFAELE